MGRAFAIMSLLHQLHCFLFLLAGSWAAHTCSPVHYNTRSACRRATSGRGRRNVV